jgi:hypothetical protein
VTPGFLKLTTQLQMTRTTKTTTAAAPEPANDPASILAAALQAMAAADPGRNASRRTAATQREQLVQSLSARDRAALTRMGWTGKLSSNKPAEPKPRANLKPGPVIRLATFRELSPERQRSAQFWAGICSTLSRSNDRLWLPEAAAVACQLEVSITGPAQLAARLAALTGCTVTRPADQAGWLLCELPGEMAGADLWAQLWISHLQAFSDAVAAEGSAD